MFVLQPLSNVSVPRVCFVNSCGELRSASLFSKPDVCVDAALVKTKHCTQSLWRAVRLSLELSTSNNNL